MGPPPAPPLPRLPCGCCGYGPPSSFSLPRLDFSFDAHPAQVRGSVISVSASSPQSRICIQEAERVQSLWEGAVCPAPQKHLFTRLPTETSQVPTTPSFILVGAPVTSASRFRQRDFLAAPIPTGKRGQNAKNHLKMKTWANKSQIPSRPRVLLNFVLQVLHLLDKILIPSKTAAVPCVSTCLHRSAEHLLGHFIVDDNSV